MQSYNLFKFGTKRLHVFFIPHIIHVIGEIAMPTPKEYRLRADECLELMNEANQWYVKTALMKLATEFQKRAERLERPNESLRSWRTTTGVGLLE